MPHSQFLVGIGHQTAGDAASAIKAYQLSSPQGRSVLAARTPDGELHGPDFLVIGAARSGTTWLKKRLSGHSAVRIRAGEPNYFSYHWTDDPRGYVAAFTSDGAIKNAGLKHDGGRRLYGEKSPSYLPMSHKKIALTRALFPRVKLICMVRDPVQRAWSDIRRRTSDFESMPFLPLVLQLGHYAEHLARWAQHFPPEQIHLIDYEDVCRQPEVVFAEVSAFLGLEAPQAKVGFPALPKPPPEIPAMVRKILESEYAGEVWDAPFLRRLVTAHWQAIHPPRAEPSPVRATG